MTGRGLGFASESNVEAGVIVDLSSEETEVLESIMEQSVLITPDLFDRIRAFVEKNRAPSSGGKSFPTDVTTILNEHVPGLWVRDLPLNFIPPSRGGELHSSWDVELEQNFENAKCLRWLSTLLQAPDSAVFFGELTSSLHDALLEDPAPYRTEVKKLVANLINWCVTLLPDQFGVETPNHSQRLFRKRRA